MPVNKIAVKGSFSLGQVFSAALLLLLIMCGATNALSHRVYLYAWVEGNTVYTESYFGSKKKVQGGLIEVYDLSGKKLLEGRTNAQGEFSFKVPQMTDLRIEVEASMGHKAEYLLKVEELPGVSESEAEPDKIEESKKASVSTVSVDAAQIRTIVERALDSRLKPIIWELVQIRKEKGPGLSEIVAGIGYIFGLMGVVMYFRSRKNR